MPLTFHLVTLDNRRHRLHPFALTIFRRRLLLGEKDKVVPLPP